MKLTLEEIQEVLSKKVKDTNIIDAILKDLEKVVEDKKEELEDIKIPKRKTEFAIVMLDETGKILSGEMTGYIVKYKEGDDSGAILGKLSTASRAFNDTKKGKKAPLTAMSDVFAFLKPKFLKQTGAGKLVIQTKEPVRIIISNNKLV